MLSKSNGFPGQIEILVRKANTHRFDRHSGIKHTRTKRYHGSSVGSGAFRKDDKLAKTGWATATHTTLTMTVICGLNAGDKLCGKRVALTHKHTLQGASEITDNGGVLEFALGDEGAAEAA